VLYSAAWGTVGVLVLRWGTVKVLVLCWGGFWETPSVSLQWRVCWGDVQTIRGLRGLRGL